MTSTSNDAAVSSRLAEAPHTLEERPSRPLGLLDQLSLWGNLGITLTIPVAAAFVLHPGTDLPPLTLGAAVVAVLVGSVLGSLALGFASAAGAETGAPAMVLLRGLVGWRGSWVPTALNIAQCVGWAAVEILVIAEGAWKLFPGVPRGVLVLAAGVLATALALRPLGFVRELRRFAVWLVLAATGYLFYAVWRLGVTPPAGGSWAGFWLAVDVVVALPISWAPLAADYSRHSRTRRDAFAGAFAGFSLAAIAYFLLGVLAITAIPAASSDPIGALLALPAGAIAIAILVLDEVDEAFANLYSTAISAQNIRPGLDRRVVVAAVGAVATLLAWGTDITQYENFLFLIGSVFIPLFATLLVDYFLLRRGRWDTGPLAPARPAMLVPWALGFTVYQLLNPGSVPGWSDLWVRLRDALGLGAAGLSASLTAFAVAAVATLAVGSLERRR